VISVSILAMAILSPPARPQGTGCSAPCGDTCGTTVPPGTIVNATWTPAGSPYCVAGDIQVSLLTIQPGVCVLVDGPYEIEVLSTINASGSSDLPITFTAKNPAVRWKGLRFQNTPPGSTLKHCRFSYSDSAAIRIFDSSPSIESCRVESNTNTGAGGGVFASIASGDLLLRECTILGNASNGNGGGISATMSSGTLRLQRCIVSQNTVNLPSGVSGGGGGVFVAGSSNLENCSIAENVVNAIQDIPGACAAIGGGLYTNAGTNVVSNCSFASNAAIAEATVPSASTFGRGGGIYFGNGSLQMSSSVLGCNKAEGDNGSQGSGIYVAGGTLGVVNSTIARGNVQGVFNAAGSVDLSSSIVYFNNSGGPQVSGAATASYCDVQNGIGGTGNISFNPAFGGTGCDISDLAIVLGSSCIDAGDPSGASNDVCFPPSLGAVRNDIGARGGPGACDWVDQNALEGAHAYCNSTRNSSGRSARIRACGSASIAANDLTLVATDCPLNKSGYFFYGFTEAHAPFGNGWRCVGGTIARLKPVLNTGPTGSATRLLDYGNLPPGVPIAPGDLRRFQFWFRDPAGGGAATNLTDGLKVFFGP
jgi:hypothetical protein